MLKIAYYGKVELIEKMKVYDTIYKRNDIYFIKRRIFGVNSVEIDSQDSQTDLDLKVIDLQHSPQSRFSPIWGNFDLCSLIEGRFKIEPTGELRTLPGEFYKAYCTKVQYVRRYTPADMQAELKNYYKYGWEEDKIVLFNFPKPFDNIFKQVKFLCRNLCNFEINCHEIKDSI